MMMLTVDHPSSKISIERVSRLYNQRILSKSIVPVVRVSRQSSLVVQAKSKHRRKRRRRRIEPTSFNSSDLQFTGTISSDRTTSTIHTDSILIKENNGLCSNENFMREKLIRSSFSSRIAEIDTTDLRQRSSERKRKRRRCGFFWICSWPCCILCCTLFVLLTAIGLTALFINLPQKNTAKTTDRTTGTTTTTSTASTTTTTRRDCGSSCVNQTWIYSSNLLAKWLFDGSFDDQNTLRNATGVNNPAFYIAYAGLGVFLDANLNQSLFAPHLPLSNTSFTITAWINVTSYPNPIFHNLLGICTATAFGRCLNIAIRRDVSNYYLYMDFFGNSCQGSINILVNTWYHVGFVFDLTTMTQSIYLNGLLDQSCSVLSPPLMLTSTTLTTIGSVPLLIPLNGSNFYHGLIDQLIVNGRVKGSCELFEEASLVARFEFDGPVVDKDLGPNNLPGYGAQYTFVPSSRSPQGIDFVGNNESHFLIEHISVLGIANHPFSIIYWIQPKNLSGSILHISSWTDGRGWCMPYMGFNINGSIFAEILSGGAVRAIAAPDLLPTDSWSHVAQTWSPTNGLRLYVNATLVASNNTLTSNSASGVPMYVYLGSGVTGLFHCAKGALPSKIPFPGAIDDFRIYNRELTAIDICTILYDDS